MTQTQRLERNLVLLCAHYGLMMCLFPVAILSVYLRDEIGLSVTTIMSAQATFAVAMALLEFPSGYLADRLGYRPALAIGSSLAACGWAWYAVASSLTSVLLAECVLGVGFALMSGADLALLSETLKEQGREDETTCWLARRQVTGQVAAAISALIAGTLYEIWARPPFVAESVVFLGVTLIGLRLTNICVSSEEVHNHSAKIKEIVFTATVARPELRRVFGVVLVLSLATYIPIWFVPLYAVDLGLPVTWLGPFWAVSSLAMGTGGALAARLRSRLGMMPVLWLIVSLICIGYFGLAVSHSLAGVAFFFCLPLSRGLQMPLLMAEEQRLIPSGDRASFVSFRSFLFRGVFFVVGPATGWVVDNWGAQVALSACGVILALASTFAVRVFSVNVQAPPSSELTFRGEFV